MAELIPLDYDAFAPVEPAEDRATRFHPTPPEDPGGVVSAPAPPEEPKPDYVVPPAPELPTVKFAEEEKAKPKPELIPLDYDPFAVPEKDKGSFVSEAGKAVAAGTVGTTGTILKGMGGQRQTAMADERARAARQKWLADNGYGDRIVEIATLPVEQQKALRDAMGAANAEALKEFNLENDIFYRMGVATTDWSDEKFKAAKDYEESWTRKLGEGFGSIAPYIAVNFVPGVGQLASYEAGYATSVGSQIDDAIKHGASKQQLIDAMRIGGVGGLTEQLPMEQLFERIPMPAMGKVVGAIVKVLGTAAAEGTQEAVQQAWQNIVAKYVYNPKQDPLEGVAESALIGSIVGGAVATPGAVVRNDDTEEPAKTDDTPDVAAPLQPPGTPAQVETPAEVATPGGLTAGTPPPPAGTEKQPESPVITQPAPAVADPRTLAKPPVSPATPAVATPIVEVVPETGTPADIGAAIGGQPIADQPVRTAVPEPADQAPPEFNIRDVIPDTATPAEVDEATREHEARIANIFRDVNEQEKRQAQMADVTKVAPGGDDVAAALKIATPQVARPENLGTGRALEPSPQAQQAAITPAPAEAAGPSAAPEALVPQGQIPAAPVAGTPAPVPSRAGTTPEEPALVPSAPAPAVAQTLAAFTPETPQSSITLPREEVTSPAPAETASQPVQVGEPQAVEPTPLPPKAAKVIEIAKRRRVAREAPGRAAVAEAPVVQPEAARVPEAAPSVEEGPRKPAPSNLSRDAAKAARDEPSLRGDPVYHLAEFPQTLDEVAAEVVAKNRKENPGASPLKIIDQSRDEIVATVKARLAEAQVRTAEADAALYEKIEKEAEAEARSLREKEAEAKKAEEEAEAKRKREEGKAQEKARRGKGLVAKQPEDIRAEKEKATRDWATEAAKQGDPEAIEWLAEHQKQARLPKKAKKGEEEELEKKRAAHVAKKAEIQERRAKKVEELIAEKGELTDRAYTVGKKLKALYEKLPLPQMAGSPRAQIESARAYLKDFVQALRDAKVDLSSKISKRYNSIEENLAIYAQKLVTNDPELEGDRDPQNFLAARLYQQGGFDKEFYGLTTNEKMAGNGYREELGADEKGDASTRGEENALVRAGRGEVRGRDAARRAREQAARKPPRDITVMRPSDEARVTVKAETRKGSDVLREVNRMLTAGKPRGFISSIQNALVKHLTAMVGDIDVHFVSEMDMMQLHTRRGESPAGLYYNYSAAQRVAGERPVVFINEEVLLNPGEYIHTALHEMTHAATSLALTLDTRGTAKIVRNLMRDLHAQLSPGERQQFGYAFKNEAEFIAEAFSNQKFQDLLGVIPMPVELRRQIGGVSSTRTPSWWDGVVGMVSNAIGMLRGRLGQSYMSQVTKLFPEIATSQAGQRQLAREALQTGTSELTGERAAAMDEQALNLGWRQFSDAAKSRANNVMAPSGARMRDTFATTGELIRRSEEPFGGRFNPFELKAKLFQKMDSIHKELRRKVEGKDANGNTVTADSEGIQLRQAEFARDNKAEWRKAQALMHEGSRHQVDFTVPLNHVHNKDVSKAGARSEPQRQKHAALEKEFSKLSPEGQQIIRDTAQYYRNASQVQSHDILQHGIENAIRYGAALPPGKTTADAIQWIMDGKADRDAAHQTQEDKDFHQALGNTATTLAKVPFLREPKGMYVPFMRRGKFFISARERPFGLLNAQRNIPHGATLDAVTPKEKEAPNRLLFHDRKDLDAFIKSYDGEVKVGFLHVDPKTGQKVPAIWSVADPSWPSGVRSAKTLLTATVQNARVEMSDNYTHLVARSAQLRSEGHHASDVGTSAKELEKAQRELATPEVSRLINNLKQTTPGANTIAQQQVAAAINDAHLRSLTSPGALARGLKRNNVLGEEVDLIKATRDYGRDMAHHLTNLRMAPQMAAADTAVTKYIDKYRHLDPPGSGRTLVRQAMNDELDDRILGYKGDVAEGKLAHIAQVVRDITFLRHLFSPHYTIMQLVQPYTTTLPVLQSKYGPGGTSRELWRAYRIGVGGALKHGVLESGRAAKNIWPGHAARVQASPEEFWLRQIRGQPDAAGLADVINETAANGYGASSGIEAGGIAEIDMNPAEKFLNRTMNIAKALPEWAESVNRYVTAIATYRLEMRQHGDHQRAVRAAALTVEETQGGYGAANNPTFFQNPLLKPATQFRKYSLAYGQLYWKNVMWSIKGDKAKRKQAVKALLGLSATLISLAGVSGLPLVEPLRMVINILAAAGLKDDDWDKDETDLQKGLASLIKWATGSAGLGDALSEAGVRGFTRLANIDTHNTFGADSLTLFGQPKSNDAEGVGSWLFKAIIGAQGGMLFDSGKALINGDLSEVIPWPKLVDNVRKAYTLATEGTVSKTTGEEYHAPFSLYEAGVKAAGFRPAEESRPFEGGEASQSQQLSETHKARGTLMAQWRAKKGPEKESFFREEIADWNASHRNPADKIQRSDLVRSVRSAKERKKRLEKAQQYEE